MNGEQKEFVEPQANRAVDCVLFVRAEFLIY